MLTTIIEVMGSPTTATAIAYTMLIGIGGMLAYGVVCWVKERKANK